MSIFWKMGLINIFGKKNGGKLSRWERLNWSVTVVWRVLSRRERLKWSVTEELSR